MAGCKVEYFPVVVAAVRAHLSEKGNCHSTTATLSGAAQLVVANGPVRRELDITVGPGASAPVGGQAPRSGGAASGNPQRVPGRPQLPRPGHLSTPARYTFCFAENEEDSPWLPYTSNEGMTLPRVR
jgi:hypothetical protein